MVPVNRNLHGNRCGQTKLRRKPEVTIYLSIAFTLLMATSALAADYAIVVGDKAGYSLKGTDRVRSVGQTRAEDQRIPTLGK